MLKHDKRNIQEETACCLRSVLLPNKNGLLLADLEGEYLGMIGRRLPLADMGHQTPLDLCHNMPDVVRLERLPGSGHLMVHAAPNEATQHIAEMVQSQRDNKEGYSKHTHKVVSQNNKAVVWRGDFWGQGKSASTYFLHSRKDTLESLSLNGRNIRSNFEEHESKSKRMYGSRSTNSGDSIINKNGISGDSTGGIQRSSSEGNENNVKKHVSAFVRNEKIDPSIKQNQIPIPEEHEAQIKKDGGAEVQQMSGSSVTKFKARLVTRLDDDERCPEVDSNGITGILPMHGQHALGHFTKIKERKNNFSYCQSLINSRYNNRPFFNNNRYNCSTGPNTGRVNNDGANSVFKGLGNSALLTRSFNPYITDNQSRLSSKISSEHHLSTNKSPSKNVLNYEQKCDNNEVTQNGIYKHDEVKITVNKKLLSGFMVKMEGENMGGVVIVVEGERGDEVVVVMKGNRFQVDRLYIMLQEWVEEVTAR